MIKKLMAVAVSIVVLSGCGGGGDDKSITEQIKDRDGIVIFHNYPAEVCKSELLRDGLSNAVRVKNVISSVEPDTVDCGDYGRVEDGASCLVREQNANSTVACVLAFDIE